MELLHRSNCHEDAEHAVVPARTAHRVQVRAHQQRRAARGGGLVMTTDVADVVAAHAHARFKDPAPDQLLRLLHRRRAERPGDALGLLAARGQLVAPRHDRLGAGHVS